MKQIKATSPIKGFFSPKQSVFLILILVQSSTVLLGQESANRTKKTDSPPTSKTESSTIEEKPDNYLDVIHFSRKAEKYKDINLKDIQLLNVVVTNFGDKVQGAREALNAIKEDYRIALRHYYKREMFLSGKKMERLHFKIVELFGNMSNYYETRADDLLTQCADAIVTIQQNEQLNNIDTEKVRLVYSNEHKLKIAYFQMGMAEKNKRDLQFKQSIVHYRLAKEYGILVLTNLSQNEETKKKILGNYKIDNIDNRNQGQDQVATPAK